MKRIENKILNSKILKEVLSAAKEGDTINFVTCELINNIDTQCAINFHFENCTINASIMAPGEIFFDGCIFNQNMTKAEKIIFDECEGKEESFIDIFTSDVSFFDVSFDQVYIRNAQKVNFSDSKFETVVLVKVGEIRGKSEFKGLEIKHSHVEFCDHLITEKCKILNSFLTSCVDDYAISCKTLKVHNVMCFDFRYECEELKSINSYGFSDFLPDGDIIGYKKLKEGYIAKLLIPANAKRVGRQSRKCRAEYVKVLDIYDLVTDEKVNIGHSRYDLFFSYVVGDVATAHYFDDDVDKVCAGGIHFFLTEQEAIDYDFI